MELYVIPKNITFCPPSFQSGKVQQKESVSPEANNSGTMNYRKFSIEPYSVREQEWSVVASYKTKGELIKEHV